jgi:hypothetical protein
MLDKVISGGQTASDQRAFGRRAARRIFVPSLTLLANRSGAPDTLMADSVPVPSP